MTQDPLLFLGLALVMMLTSVIFTWVFNNTGGSVLAAMLLHTSMNWSIWLILPGMQVNAAIVGLWIILLAVAVVLTTFRWGARRLCRAAE